MLQAAVTKPWTCYIVVLYKAYSSGQVWVGPSSILVVFHIGRDTIHWVVKSKLHE